MSQIQFYFDNIGKLVIDILSYEREQSNDEYDLNWLNGILLLDIHYLRCEFQFSLLTFTLYRWNEQISSLLNNKNQLEVLENIEGNILLKITKSKFGNFEVNCKIYDGVRTNLELVCETNFTDLKSFQDDIVQTLSKFAIRSNQIDL